MSLDLLNELEKRVQSAVATIEELKAEIELLKDEKALLVAEKDAWEGRLAELLGKFDLMDSAAPAAEADDAFAEDDNLSAEEALAADEAAAAEDSFAGHDEPDSEEVRAENSADFADSEFDSLEALDSVDSADNAEENLVGDAFSEDAAETENVAGFGNASSY